MKGADPYWYDLATGAVQRAEERPEGAALGPFPTSEEAAEAPDMLLTHARAWLESDEVQPFLDDAQKAAAEDPGADRPLD